MAYNVGCTRFTHAKGSMTDEEELVNRFVEEFDREVMPPGAPSTYDDLVEASIKWVDHELKIREARVKRPVIDYPLHSWVIEIRPALCNNKVSVTGVSRPKPPKPHVPEVQVRPFRRGTFASQVLPLDKPHWRPMVWPDRSIDGQSIVTFRCSNCNRMVHIPNPWSWRYRMCDCGLRWTRWDVRGSDAMARLGVSARVYG